MNNQIKLLEDTIEKVMTLFSEEFPGKFVITDTRIDTWILMLRDFHPSTIQHAAYQLASELEWPPPIGKMRQTCALMEKGINKMPTGNEAWERVLRKIHHDQSFELNEREKKALKQTKSLADMRTSGNIDADRARYIEAFDKLIDKEMKERITLPEVKRFLVERRAELKSKDDTTNIRLPAKQDRAKLLDAGIEPEYEDPEKVSDLCQEVIQNIEDKNEKD